MDEGMAFLSRETRATCMGNSSSVQTQVRRPARRPTVMDRRFRGDPWVEDRHDGTLSLYLGNYPLAALQALALDLPHLNQLLERLRQGPRTRGGLIRSPGDA